MSEPPDITGFFSYARQDDADSNGFLSNLRAEIQRSLRSQLGIPPHKLKLFQDDVMIPPGAHWQADIEAAIAQSSFFILIVSPAALNSPHCKTEFDAFLAREKQLGRTNRLFPIVCFPRTGLDDPSRIWPANPVRDIIAARQFVNWKEHRHDRNLEDKAFRRTIGDWCAKVIDALDDLTLAKAQVSAGAAAGRQSKETRPGPPPAPLPSLTDAAHASAATVSFKEPRAAETGRPAAQTRTADEKARQAQMPAGPPPKGTAEPRIPAPPPNLTEAQARFWRDAQAGSPEAQFFLARMYETGDGLAKNIPQAAAWYRKAADQFNAAAMYNLGNILAAGEGVPKDERAAVALYRTAANLNYADAQCQLAWMLVRGKGVARNESEAVAWYRRASASGNPVAHNNLAIMLVGGYGTPKDEKAAAELYRKAIALGVAEAKSNLALLPEHIREPRAPRQS